MKEFLEANDIEYVLKLVEHTFGKGAAELCRERYRQVTDEGWDANHDDEHEDGELADAGAVYLMNPEKRDVCDDAYMCRDVFDILWPFNHSWYKPTADELTWPIDPTTVSVSLIDRRITEIKKGGALAAAEIDRLERLRERKKRVDETTDDNI